jgi:hypothetical protein
MNRFRACVTLAVVATAPAYATAVLALSFEQMTQRSAAVVRGTVGASESLWDAPHHRIFTYTEIRTDEALKGKVLPVVLVRSPGGVVGGTGQRVEGSPAFTSGESVVLFLEPVPGEPDALQVMALAAGKVTLGASRTGDVRATRDLSGISQYAMGAIDRQPRLEVQTREDLGNAQVFLSRIRVAARNGGAR